MHGFRREVVLSSHAGTYGNIGNTSKERERGRTLPAERLMENRMKEWACVPVCAYVSRFVASAAAAAAALSIFTAAVRAGQQVHKRLPAIPAEFRELMAALRAPP